MSWYGLSREERCALVRPMIEDGITFAKIGEHCGTSRHCIAGFVFRNMKDAKPKQRRRYEWTAAMTERVFELARAGLTPKQIASAIPRGPDERRIYEKTRPLRRKTKAQRIAEAEEREAKEAAKRKAAANERRAAAMIRFKQPKAVPLPKLREIPDLAPKPLIDRRMGFECAWVIGDPRARDPQCCGAPTGGEASWCKGHREIVFGRAA